MSAFNCESAVALRSASPFVSFRFHLDDGRTVVVPTRGMILLGQDFAIVGTLDEQGGGRLANGWQAVWYSHVRRVEQLLSESG